MNSRSKKMFEALKNIDMVEKQPNQMRSQVTPQENILSDISNQISSPTMNSFYSPSIELTKNEIPFDIYQSEQNTRQNMHNVTEPTLSPRPSTTAVQNIPSCSKYYVCEKADSLKLSLRKIQPTTYREYTENEIEPFSGGSSDEYTPSHEDYSSSSSSTSSSSQLCTVVKERKDTMPSSVTKELVIPPIVSNITVSGSNHLEIEAGDTVRDNDVPVKGKKRIRKEDTWTRVKTKKLKNSGKAYRTKTGRLVPERNIKPPCPEKCILGCNKKFVEEFRRKLFQDYWGLASFQRQRDFLGSCIERLELKYRRISAANPRNQNCAFYLQNDGKKVRVCKLFLMNTLGLSERTLRTVIKSKVSGSGIIPEDQRGKHNNHKKTEEEILNSIRIHIDSIPRIESHYVRSDTSRQFIDGGLSIAELHRNYKKKREDLEKEPASYDTYAKIFNTEYNIGFFAPKKDQCDQCEAYKNAIEDQKGQLETKYKEHLEEKDLSRKEKEKEKERAKNHEITLAVYDLQAVMPIPVGQTSAFFYKSRLNCFNFTVTEIGNDKSKAFFWHEALGHRGAVEIGTCILNYLTDISETTPEANVVFFSDNCGGQQKNRFLIGTYIYAVECLNINSITHHYLVRGHTQNEGDAVHSVIEKAIRRSKKSGPIYVPEQYVSIIRSAKKKGNPIEVKEMSFNDFMDLKSLYDEMSLNISKDIEGNDFKISDVRVLKFEKNSSMFQFKTSYRQEEWSSVIFRTKKRRSDLKDIKSITVKQAYSKQIQLSENKRKDLKSLIDSHIIPDFYRYFFDYITI